MRKIVLSLFAAAATTASLAEYSAYQATAKNTPCAGYHGKVESVQFASTNLTGTATISSVTDLLVNGGTVSFTNVLATATLVDGVATIAPTNVFVAAGQRIVVGGSAFPGGSAIVWVKK